jgi:predicted RNA methylase
VRTLFAIAAASLLLSCTPSDPAAPAEVEAVDAELLATYYPTPEIVVQRMLKAVDLQPGEIHFDLGSGDGRFVLAAAGHFGANSTGFEINPDLITVSRERIREAGMSDRARILSQDLLTADFAAADVISAFLTPEGYVKLEPLLRQTVRGDTRVVAYKFPVPGWEPIEVITFEDSDPTIPTHQIFIYRGVSASSE